jgi:Protein of unknown function (DUF3306)
MSEPESFFSRWLRLKREAETAMPPADTPSPTAFDPASLPPIESIVADSDIQQFLNGAVPPELTKAALRSAWTADPAIRDFIGIAENQWDFNDHACMPGFGPLEAADYLAAQALANLTDAAHEAGRTGEPPPSGSQPPTVLRPAAMPVNAEKTVEVVTTVGEEESAGAGEGGASGSGAAPARSHGGALPR